MNRDETQQNQDRRQLTLKELNAARSPKGGHVRETLASWGVPWPPPKGWKMQILRNGIPYDPTAKLYRPDPNPKPVDRRVEKVLRFAKALTGLVDAKCFSCGKMSRIPSTSWESVMGKKPKCDCGGMVYLANPSLVVVKQSR